MGRYSEVTLRAWNGTAFMKQKVWWHCHPDKHLGGVIDCKTDYQH